VSTWRLIIDGPADGAWNMAVDRAVLAAHESGDVPPTLRLYRWDRPTVSLGRFQATGDVDAAYCEARGIGVCRRPTGGRGVLHDDELTYSAVAGVRDGLPRGVSASYRVLCSALVAAYRSLGIDAALTPRERGSRGAGACYLHATHADLSLGAAKLSGSAQVWKGSSCLQHGSFVISRDVEREARVFRLDAAAAAALDECTVTIERVTGARPAEVALIEALSTGFEQAFGADFMPGSLTDAEVTAARSFVREHALTCGETRSATGERRLEVQSPVSPASDTISAGTTRGLDSSGGAQ
jgi:lipoate-protein ligase A